MYRVSELQHAFIIYITEKDLINKSRIYKGNLVANYFDNRHDRHFSNKLSNQLSNIWLHLKCVNKFNLLLFFVIYNSK